MNATIKPVYADSSVTAAPANGAAVVGNVPLLGINAGPGTGSGTQTWPIYFNYVLSGLTVGHTYWFDMNVSCTQGFQALQMHCQFIEY